MVFSFWQYLLGYLIISVEGEAPENLVNLAVAQGIVLGDIRQAGEHLKLKIGISGFKALRPLARAARCRVRIEKKVGFPFLLKRVKRRKVLAAGSIALLAALYFVTSFVWFIEIRGIEALSPDELLRAASEAGLRPGASKWRLDPVKIERKLLRSSERVAWVNLTLRGTRAVIEVVEKTLPPQEVEQPPDLVAAKNGVVTKLLVFKGEPAVKEGDTVKRGQLLVRKPPDSDRARAAVLARVWYEAYAEQPLQVIHRVPTGASYHRRSLRYGDRELVLSGREPAPFESYETETRRLPAWRNGRPAVELIITTFYEIQISTEEFDEETAVELAKDRALQILKSQIPEGARVLNHESRTVKVDKGIIGVKVSIETEEDIAVGGR